MNTTVLLVIIAVLFLLGIGAVFYFFFNEKKNQNIETLINVNKGNSGSRFGRKSFQKPEMKDEELEQLTEAKRRDYRKDKDNKKLTLEDRLFHAGLLTTPEQEKFKKLKVALPIIFAVVLGLIGFIFVNPKIAILMIIVGLIFGIIGPSFYIDRLIKNRGEEIMYYLPLVIEQIAIGVSSSLDIGPCLQRVIEMADERDSHNVVSELIYNVQRYIKSGVGLEESLTEVGTRSGHTELKHAFMALAQVAKHGGEISSQLQELANAVSSRRETMIDGRIKTLELKATGPVALVLVSFILTLLIGIFIKIKNNI